MGNLPPGFRFRPTDEELVNYYLRNKNRGNDEAVVAFVAEVDVYNQDPTELPGLSALKTGDSEWYFFCPVPRNYPNGQQLGRSTKSGYWKSTGKDRQIKSGDDLIGMKKNLVFHRGRGTTAERTDWVIHEYRAAATDPAAVQSHFVLCRVFDKQRRPANSEPMPELIQEFLARISDTANMLPHVEGQSSGCAPVSETNQMTNPLELGLPPLDWDSLGPLCSHMPTPSQHLEAENIPFDFQVEKFWSKWDSTVIMENGSGEGSYAPPCLEAQMASFTLSSGSTASQFHDGHDELHNQTDAQTNQGRARRRCRLQTKRRVRTVKMESGDEIESSMPEDHKSKSIDKEGPKAGEKDIAILGHSAAIAVSELKQSSPFEPSSNSEELITNDREARNPMTTILMEGEITKASRDRFSFWSFADIFRLAAVGVMLLILVISHTEISLPLTFRED